MCLTNMTLIVFAMGGFLRLDTQRVLPIAKTNEDLKGQIPLSALEVLG